jgi:hypothetical protein
MRGGCFLPQAVDLDGGANQDDISSTAVRGTNPLETEKPMIWFRSLFVFLIELAFSLLALFSSIFRYQPSPFCQHIPWHLRRV